jgi:hypothetical protein
MEVTPGAKFQYGNKKALRLRLRAFVILLRSTLGALYFLQADKDRYAIRRCRLCEEVRLRVDYHSAYPSVPVHSTAGLTVLASLFLVAVDNVFSKPNNWFEEESAAMGILDRFRLDGKCALVLGSATGLGAAIAIALFSLPRLKATTSRVKFWS